MADKLVGFLNNNAGTLINAGSGIVATGLNALFTKRENERNRKWTEQQNDLAWNRQRQLIDEQRAYDTPKEQMRRLMEAGLNPNLIYGGVDQSPMAAQTAPSAAGKYAGVAPQVDPYVASEISKNMAEIRRLDTQNENETNMTQGQLNRWRKENDVSDALCLQIKNTASKIQEETRNLGKEWILMDKMERLKNYEIQIKEKTWEKEVEDFGYQVNMHKDEARYFSRMLLARINNLDASTLELKESASLKKSQAALTDAQKSYLDRVADDLVSIVSSQAGQEESMDKILEFQRKHTNNWEYWIKYGLDLYNKSADRGVQLLSSLTKVK